MVCVVKGVLGFVQWVQNDSDDEIFGDDDEEDEQAEDEEAEEEEDDEDDEDEQNEGDENEVTNNAGAQDDEEENAGEGDETMYTGARLDVNVCLAVRVEPRSVDSCRSRGVSDSLSQCIHATLGNEQHGCVVFYHAVLSCLNISSDA